MQKNYLVTFAGADRPGIMDAIAVAIATHGGNWLDSRLAHLGSYFAGVIRYATPESQALDIRRSLEALGDTGLRIDVHEEAESSAGRIAESHSAKIAILGMDRPGIVSRITSSLATHHINIEEFTSRTEAAPMSGEPLFRAAAEVTFPANLPLDQIRNELETIARELDIEIDVA